MACCPPAPSKAKIFRWLEAGIRHDMLAARQAALDGEETFPSVCKLHDLLRGLLQTLGERVAEDGALEARYAILAAALSRLVRQVQGVTRFEDLRQCRMHVADTLDRFLFVS